MYTTLVIHDHHIWWVQYEMGPNYDTACDESTMKPIGLDQTRDLRYWWNNAYYIQMRTRMYIYIDIYNHMFMHEHQSIPQLVLNLYALEGTVVWLMSRWSKPEIVSHVRSANVTWSRANKIFSDVLRERNHELAIFRSHFHHFLCILYYAVGFFGDFPWFSRPFSTQNWHRHPRMRMAGSFASTRWWHFFTRRLSWKLKSYGLRMNKAQWLPRDGDFFWNLWILEAGGIRNLVT